MHAAEDIRRAVNAVMALRAQTVQSPAYAGAVHAIKDLQARRFAHTYADFADEPGYAGAVQFFLTELYAARDFSDRDQQFARIAGALERLLPAAAVQTAVSLARLHALSENLDHQMALTWLAQADDTEAAMRYVRAWRQVGASAAREEQLTTVLALGHELIELTGRPGLLTLLKTMRAPARLAGLGALQNFLETGFMRFQNLTRRPGQAVHFLATIERREREWLARLYSGAEIEVAADLNAALQTAQ